MKVFILNSSGNVGKSTIAREVFASRMQDALIIEIETVNSSSAKFDSINTKKYKANDDFTHIYMDMIENENVIMDVGASNLSAFWVEMSKFAGIAELFDFFIVPTKSNDKIQEDTYKTIRFLRSEGIEDEKIKVIFNGVENGVERDFEMLLTADFAFDTTLYLNKNESLFNDLGFLRQTILDIYTPDTETYKEMILEEKDPTEKFKLIKRDIANRMAVKVKEKMDYIFEETIGLKSCWKIPEKKDKKTAKEKVSEKKTDEIEEDL